MSATGASSIVDMIERLELSAQPASAVTPPTLTAATAVAATVDKDEAGPSHPPRYFSWRGVLEDEEEAGPSHPPPSYSRRTVLVDSLPALRDMLWELRDAREVAVDCEGLKLDRHGKLCLLALAPDAHLVFLVDVSQLGAAAFDTPGEEVAAGDGGDGASRASGSGLTVKSLLEDASVMKLLYDVRCDSDALYHQYGIRLRGVLDLQMAELYCRSQRYKASIKYLAGLERALDEHLPLDFGVQRRLTGVNKETMRTNFYSDPLFWDRRPLTDEQLRYAADDVAYLHPLRKALMPTIRVLDPHQTDELAPALTAILKQSLDWVLELSAIRTLEYKFPYDQLPKGRDRAKAPAFFLLPSELLTRIADALERGTPSPGPHSADTSEDRNPRDVT